MPEHTLCAAFTPPGVCEASPEGLEDVTETLWDTQVLVGTVAPKAGLIEHMENHVVVAITPRVEQIQGTTKPSRLSSFFQGFGEGEGES